MSVCFSDLLKKLQDRGVVLTESQIRWAIRSGRVSTPKRDGALRFVFTEQHVDELCKLAKIRRQLDKAIQVLEQYEY